MTNMTSSVKKYSFNRFIKMPTLKKIPLFQSITFQKALYHYRDFLPTLKSKHTKRDKVKM